MSRGVVLWPEATAAAAIRGLWDVLEDHGVPSLATHTHGLHQPHCSLSVAEQLPAEAALAAVGTVPSRPIPLLIGSAGVFPPQGALFLACVPNRPLLDEQARVHRAVAPLAPNRWPFFELDAWVPHITLSMALAADQLSVALRAVMERLPIMGTFDHGGIEDGTTGENWPAPSPM